jgi:hypothetical protein
MVGVYTITKQSETALLRTGYLAFTRPGTISRKQNDASLAKPLHLLLTLPFSFLSRPYVLFLLLLGESESPKCERSTVCIGHGVHLDGYVIQDTLLLDLIPLHTRLLSLTRLLESIYSTLPHR